MRRPVSICATEFLSTSTGRATIVYDGINNWPRLGPATYCAMTQEDELRIEANPQLDKHLKASPQVAESVPGTLSRWRHGFKSRWDYQEKRRSEVLSGAGRRSTPFSSRICPAADRHTSQLGRVGTNAQAVDGVTAER